MKRESNRREGTPITDRSIHVRLPVELVLADKMRALGRRLATVQRKARRLR